MTDFELFLFGIFFGWIIAIIFIGAGALINDKSNDRNTKRKLDDDSDVHIYIPKRSKCWISNNRYVKQIDSEEIINGLQKLQKSTSLQEKIYLNYACNCVKKINDLQNIIKEVRESE